MKPVGEKARGRFDVAFEVGQWSYWNDEPCPYPVSDQHGLAEWYRGFLAASQADEQATIQRERSTTA